MKFLLTALLLTLLASCGSNTTRLNGKITNADSDALVLSIPYYGTADTIATLAKDGFFSASVMLEEPHMARLSNGPYGMDLYLRPGSKLEIRSHLWGIRNQNTNPAAISGKGSEATILMHTLNQMHDEFDLMGQTILSAPEFDQNAENLKKAGVKLITQFRKKHNAQHFIELVQLDQDLKMARLYDYYLNYHPIYTPDDSIPIPHHFYRKADSIPADNYEAMRELLSYKSFITDQTLKDIERELKEENIRPHTVLLYQRLFDKIAELQKPQTLKDEVVNKALEAYTSVPDTIRAIMRARYKESLANQEYINNFRSLVAKMNLLKPGTRAPYFAFKDIEGREVSSQDLLGKVVYIDIWATWSGPSKGEIPFLKTLQKELRDQDIAFVSISVDENENDWKKTVADKELNGYQLRAPEAWKSKIIDDYAIQGIPRFIILDKQGRLVEYNASSPSNPDTKTLLLKLTKS